MACVKYIVKSCYQTEIRCMNALQPVLLLVLRLYFG